MLYLVPQVSWVGQKAFIRYSTGNPVLLDLEKKTKKTFGFHQKKIDFHGLKKIIEEGGAAAAPRAPFQVSGQFFSIEYGTIKPEEPTTLKKGFATVQRIEADTSTVLGRYEYPMPSSRPFLFPLENGKWFAINVNGEKDGRPTQEVFFHLRLDEKGSLACDDVLNSGLGDLLKNQWVRLAIRAARPILFSETHAVLCLYEYGLLWSIRLKDGQLSGPFRLYDSLTDKRITDSLLLRPVVNLQPTPDGRIIVAARPEEAVLKGGELIKRIDDYQNQIAAGLNPRNASEALKSVRSMWDTLYVTYPFVHWLEFNPATGSFKRLNPPPFGAKEMIHSQKEFNTFFWIMDAKDDVQFFDDFLSGFKEENPKAVVADPPAPVKKAEPKKEPKKELKKESKPAPLPASQQGSGLHQGAAIGGLGEEFS